MRPEHLIEGKEYVADRDGGFRAADGGPGEVIYDCLAGEPKATTRNRAKATAEADAKAVEEPGIRITAATMGFSNPPAPVVVAPVDFLALKKSLLLAVRPEVERALDAERTYGVLVQETGDILAPESAIERLRKEIGSAETTAGVMAKLSTISALHVAGSESRGFAERLLKRKWAADVLPELRNVIAQVRTRLDAWKGSIGEEKAELLSKYGHLGVSKVLAVEESAAALGRHLAHLGEQVERGAEGRPLDPLPSRNLLRNWLGDAF